MCHLRRLPKHPVNILWNRVLCVTYIIIGETKITLMEIVSDPNLFECIKVEGNRVIEI